MTPPSPTSCSRSAQVSLTRPFYAYQAEVYDLLVTDPVQPWIDTVAALLPRTVPDRPRVLDAGCGTGRHAAAMVERGWDVHLIDAAPAMLAIARRRCPTAPATLADLCRLERNPVFEAVACRGVLNDLTEDVERLDAIAGLAEQLRPDGVLILDVREADAARARADGLEQRRNAELEDGTTLQFSSWTRWQDGLLLVHERHQYQRGSTMIDEPVEYDFAMRPWSVDGITDALRDIGLQDIAVRPGMGRRGIDRIVVTARRRP